MRKRSSRRRFFSVLSDCFIQLCAFICRHMLLYDGMHDDRHIPSAAPHFALEPRRKTLSVNGNWYIFGGPNCGPQTIEPIRLVWPNERLQA